ncbi:MAG TPA: hypothetical protein PK854_01995 [Oscillospiraceae bacterium]|nr:hypothetical protein [Oscillospiraceae bacterium]HPS34020.1 hypothetical protein [Oscillospiraceae bacterium]
MKKYIAVLEILLAAVLFSISFSGTQTRKIQSYSIAEGGSLTLTAYEGSAYYWYIGDDANQKYFCNTDTALKYGVEFLGSNSRTLTIKSVNPKKFFAMVSCWDKEQPYSGNKYVGNELFICFVSLTSSKTKISSVPYASSAPSVISATFNSPIPKLEYNLKMASVNPGETINLIATHSLKESVKGLISYQWYESAKSDYCNAKAISDAISDTYTIDGNTHSGTTRYYYCIITNELNGEKYTNKGDGMEMVEITFAGEHIHAYSEWKIKTEPTCTENGVKTRTCECGDKQQEVISALGHTFSEWAVKTAANETAEGQEERSCIKCGAVESRIIPRTETSSESASSIPITQINGQSADQFKTKWWIFAIVLIGIAGGAVYGLILIKKKKSNSNL